MRLRYIFLLFASLLNGDVNVYTSKDSSIDIVTKQDLANVYLKKTNELNGKNVNVVNNKENYDEFNKKVLDKTPSQMHAYWMKQIFLGKKVPPKTVNKADVESEISNDKSTVIYSSDKIGQKVIHEVK